MWAHSFHMNLMLWLLPIPPNSAHQSTRATSYSFESADSDFCVAKMQQQTERTLLQEREREREIGAILSIIFLLGADLRTCFRALLLLHDRDGVFFRNMGSSPPLVFYITICCIAFIISKIIISLLCYKRWLRKRRIIEENLAGGKMVMFRSPATQALNSKDFMKKATKLTNKDIIGSGGFGTVYRLVVDENTAFAVKRLNRGNTDKDAGFERELNAMGDIKHRNIVTLHGYYIAPQFNLLIYELMPNGSLEALLHRKSGEENTLDWPSRYRIAVGAARGIAYLHHDCIPHIIHRDIKSSNILLDQNMDARVSDFGLATLMKPDQSHVSTMVAGTFGYLPPEYFDTGRATTKGDVYSFGVVLLELLTGKRPTDETFIEEGSKLVTWVKGVMEEKREEHAIDSNLVCFPAEEVNKVFAIAEKCLESDPSKRPTMSEVLKMLEQIKSDQSDYVS